MDYEFEFNEAFSAATNEQLWEQIRHHRNMLLKSTDWTQISDSTADKTAWAKYRQALRDLPAQNTDLKKIKFPTRPE